MREDRSFSNQFMAHYLEDKLEIESQTVKAFEGRDSMPSAVPRKAEGTIEKLQMLKACLRPVSEDPGVFSCSTRTHLATGPLKTSGWLPIPIHRCETW